MGETKKVGETKNKIKKGAKKEPQNRMKSADRVNHLRVLDPIPESASTNPVEWATSHLEKQIPLAAKELEWQLKFGDMRTRREIALETLAFKGISSKGTNNATIVPTIQLIMNAPLPWSQATSLGAGNNNNSHIEGEVVSHLVATKTEVITDEELATAPKTESPGVTKDE